MQSDKLNNTIEPGRTACGGKLSNTDGFPGAIYHVEEICFCTRACLRVFQQFPDDFMAGNIEHPLGED